MQRWQAHVMIVMCLVATAPSVVRGQTVATWNVNGNGTWNVNGNWASSDSLFPNGVGAVASLTNDITVSSTVSLTASATIGTLTLGDASGTLRFRLLGSGTLTLNQDAGTTPAAINKIQGGNDYITAPITLTDDLVIANSTNSPATNGTGHVSFTSVTGLGRNITVTGGSSAAGTVNIASNAFNVGGGKVIVNGGILNLGIRTGSDANDSLSGATNAINTAASIEVGGNSASSSQLRQGLSGGTNGNIVSQTTATLSLKSGYSTFSVATTGNDGPNQMILNFGTTGYSRDAGAVVHWERTSSALATRKVTTSTSASVDFGGTRVVIGASTSSDLTVSTNARRVTAFVSQDSASGEWGTLVPSGTNATSLSQNDFALYNANTSLTAANHAAATLQVRQNTLTINAGNSLTIGSGMVMMGNPGGTTGGTISGGVLKADGPELIVMGVTGIDGAFSNTINSVIADKDGSTATRLTVNLGAVTSTAHQRLILGGANTFSGETIINGNLLAATGTGGSYVQLNHSDALQNSTLNNTSTLRVRFGSGVTSATVGGLAGSTELPLQNLASTPAAVALKVGNNNASTTYSGTLSAAGSLEKIGSGALTLAGASTYSGATTVTAGILRVNGSIASSSGVTVAAAGTLAGSGAVAAIGGAGLISPGNSPGILTAPSVNLGSGVDFAFEFFQAGQPTWGNALASGNDVLRLTDGTTPIAGTVSSGNVFDIYFAATDATYVGGLFTDLNSDFASLLTGATFNYYVQDAGGAVPFGGLSYSTLDPGTVSRSVIQVGSAAFADQTVTNGYAMQFVVVVPEPGGFLLAAVGITAAIAARLRRNRPRA